MTLKIVNNFESINYQRKLGPLELYDPGPIFLQLYSNKNNRSKRPQSYLEMVKIAFYKLKVRYFRRSKNFLTPQILISKTS